MLFLAPMMLVYIQSEHACLTESDWHEFLLEFDHRNFTKAVMRLLWEMPPSNSIVAPPFSSLGLLFGLCCSSWGPVSRLARLAPLGSLVGLRCSS